MKLIHTEHSSRKDKNFLAYYLNWNYSKDNGNYTNGNNFLSVHWEISDSNRNVIKLHVEAPIYITNPALNRIKQKIIIILLSKIAKLNTCNTFDSSIGTFELGSQIHLGDNNKSTTVFKITFLSPNNDIEQNFSVINHIFEKVINDSINKTKDLITQEKLIAQESFN